MPRRVETETGSPYRLHVERYRDGCGADECAFAKRVVHCRGDLPADVVFVGEAPGESEDCIGRPFVGPAGHLLDQIVARSCGRRLVCLACERGHLLSLDRRAVDDDGGNDQVYCGLNMHEDEWRPVRVAFANLVGCVPRTGPGTAKQEPSFEQVEACAPRLTELLAIARPRLVVLVGAVARSHMTPGFVSAASMPGSVRYVEEIVHPSAVLKGSVAARALTVQRCVHKVQDALDRVEDL